MRARAAAVSDQAPSNVQPLSVLSAEAETSDPSAGKATAWIGWIARVVRRGVAEGDHALARSPSPRP